MFDVVSFWKLTNSQRFFQKPTTLPRLPSRSCGSTSSTAELSTAWWVFCPPFLRIASASHGKKHVWRWGSKANTTRFSVGLQNLDYQRHAAESKDFEIWRKKATASSERLKTLRKERSFQLHCLWIVSGFCFKFIIVCNFDDLKAFRWLLASSRASCKKMRSTTALRLHSRRITRDTILASELTLKARRRRALLLAAAEHTHQLHTWLHTSGRTIC